jgi:hypothetical protein
MKFLKFPDISVNMSAFALGQIHSVSGLRFGMVAARLLSLLPVYSSNLLLTT